MNSKSDFTSVSSEELMSVQGGQSCDLCAVAKAVKAAIDKLVVWLCPPKPSDLIDRDW